MQEIICKDSKMKKIISSIDIVTVNSHGIHQNIPLFPITLNDYVHMIDATESLSIRNENIDQNVERE